MDRLKEASTWGGVGLLLMAVNQIFDVNEAGQVGEAMSQASATGDLKMIVMSGLAALAAIFVPEKK